LAGTNTLFFKFDQHLFWSYSKGFEVHLGYSNKGTKSLGWVLQSL